MAAHYFPGPTISKRYTTLRDATNYSYAKEILPGVYRFLATVDSGFKPLSDADLPEGFSLDQPVLGDANFPGTDQPATNYTFLGSRFRSHRA